MAGSLNHIVDDDTGKFTMKNIENLGDAQEALEECYEIISTLSDGGSMQIINKVCQKLEFPVVKTRAGVMVGKSDD